MYTLSRQAERINDELRAGGAVTYDLILPETHQLPDIIHDDEHIYGSVYGKHSSGRGALIATDKRILFIDKKPLFLHLDEIDFGVVGGVTITHAGLWGIVTLHTPMGDYSLRTFNRKNAQNFVDYVEVKCLRRKVFNQRTNQKFSKGDDDDNTAQER